MFKKCGFWENFPHFLHKSFKKLNSCSHFLNKFAAVTHVSAAFKLFRQKVYKLFTFCAKYTKNEQIFNKSAHFYYFYENISARSIVYSFLILTVTFGGASCSTNLSFRIYSPTPASFHISRLLSSNLIVLYFDSGSDQRYLNSVL